MIRRLSIAWLTITISFFSSVTGFAEGGNEYKGISDPFGDPTNYEFAEDEKEDKEFFHLGRYIMLGVNGGLGIFTGGLGKTVAPGFMIGGKLVYFFDKHLALDGTIGYSSHLDTIRVSADQTAEIDTTMLPITLGMRYYFSIDNAPKAIAAANPYLAFGAGLYIRNQTVISSRQITFTTSDTSTNNFGAYAGAGVEFPIYRRHIFLGLDLRYHLVFFSDEDSNLQQTVPDGSRSGDFITTLLNLTYNF